MKVSESDQRSILDIQKFDHQMSTLKNKAANLPELAEIASTTIKSNNVRDLRIAGETELSDVKRELARAEGDVEQIVTRIERDEKRLASGTGTPKELEQTQHELGTLGARRSELEEVELEIMMRVDGIKDRIATLSQEENELGMVLVDLNIRKENALAAIHTELEGIETDRKATTQSVNAEFLALYEKIRAGSNGIGAAALAGNQCKGCNLTLNTIELQRIAGLAQDEVVRCEECRCILVRDK
ncbi:zinc ribbon domain-containing protein [Candidatus Planktophila dulcis]|uniref:zinc ribbon domain-containing protein n=1 Tax=Candidatus Planktophila dulcis TaxID=1884914 RepID=UPI003BEF31B3